MSSLFKAFNALQITALFAGFPFLLNWLHTATFYASNMVFWIGCVIYFIFFCLMTGSVFSSEDELWLKIERD